MERNRHGNGFEWKSPQHTLIHSRALQEFFERKRVEFEIWFLGLMAYQPSWVIWCQSYPSRRTVVVLFNPKLRDKGVHTFSKGISPKVKVIEGLDFKLAYYNVAVEHINYSTKGTSLFEKEEELWIAEGILLPWNGQVKEGLLQLIALIR